MSSTFLKEIATRRTIYGLSKQGFPIKNAQVVKIVEDIVAVTPSSFNNQTNRAIIVFGTKHDKLWNSIVHNAVKSVTPADQFEGSAQKIAGFGNAYGTVLFFQDTDVIKDFEKKFALYAANFAPWAEQSSGSAQISTWSALALENVGANLQHYNELISAQVAKEFNVPANWKLSAQLVFGAKASGPLEKQTLPASKTVKVFE